MNKLETKALQYAEKYGIVEYEINKRTMVYYENYPNEGKYECKVNLNTMKEKRKNIK